MTIYVVKNLEFEIETFNWESFADSVEAENMLYGCLTAMQPEKLKNLHDALILESQDDYDGEFTAASDLCNLVLDNIFRNYKKIPQSGHTISLTA